MGGGLEVHSRQQRLLAEGEGASSEVGEDISRTGVDNKGLEEGELHGGTGEEGGAARS